MPETQKVHEPPPTPFNAVILTSAILNPGLDWEGRAECGHVGRVVNEIGGEDVWVRRMQIVAAVSRHRLQGSAGWHGFRESPVVENRRTLTLTTET